MRQESKDRVPGSGGRSSAPAPRRRRGGFTLIEMLVVVFIMALLMGLLVRNMRNSDERAKRAATENTIEKVKAAIEEFYAEYGQYPPVPVYPGDNCQPIYFEFPAKYTSPPLKSGHPLLKMSGTDVLVPEFIDKTHPDSKERLFTLGLVSFLVPRYEGVRTVYSHLFNQSYWSTLGAWTTPGGADDMQWKFHTPAQYDQPRDLNAIARWAPFLEGVIRKDAAWSRTNALVHSGAAWVNLGFTIQDAWGKDLRYESIPPYQSYRLWSDNPNMRD